MYALSLINKKMRVLWFVCVKIMSDNLSMLE